MNQPPPAAALRMPSNPDDTGAQIAVLQQRVTTAEKALEEHDGHLGAILGALGRIEGSVSTAKWLFPMFGGVLVIVTGVVVAVVSHWK